MVVKLCQILHALDELRAMFDSWPSMSSVHTHAIFADALCGSVRLNSKSNVVVRSSLLQSNELAGFGVGGGRRGTSHVSSGELGNVLYLSKLSKVHVLLPGCTKLL